jgi:hypothetical protein
MQGLKTADQAGYNYQKNLLDPFTWASAASIRSCNDAAATT